MPSVTGAKLAPVAGPCGHRDVFVADFRNGKIISAAGNLPPSPSFCGGIPVTSNSIRAIIENAGRLTLDAELLLEHRRHASALVLAIYAVEELGKASLVDWEDLKETASKTKRVHEKKQSVLGSLYGAYVAVASVSVVMQRVGVSEHYARKPEFFHPFVAALRTHPETERFADGLFDAVVEIAAMGLANDPKARLLKQAGGGGIERMKRNALYVDLPWVEGAGPDAVTREMAREWVEHARFFYDYKRGAGVGYYPVTLPDTEFQGLFGELRDVLATKRLVPLAGGFKYEDQR